MDQSRTRVGGIKLLLSLTAVAMLVGTHFGDRAVAAGCPNESVRTGPSAGLPDCRAYEMVSPVDKQGIDVPSISLVRSSASGDGVVFTAYGAFSGAPSASNDNYLARRTSDGWAVASIDPPLTVGSLLSNENLFEAFDPELGKGILRHYAPPSLAPGDDPEHWNVYLRDNASGSYAVTTPLQQTATGSPPIVENVTPDLSAYALDTPNGNVFIPEGPSMAAYTWSASAGLRLASLEVGTATPFETAGVGSGSGYVDRALADDGSRLYFTSPSSGSQGEPPTGAQLYLRVDSGTPDADTVDVSTPEAGVVDPNGTQAAWYRTASVDGSRAFFTSTQKLTSNATADSATGSADLYMYDAVGGSLTDLTTGDPAGAGIMGVVGASDDGTVVYLVARGVLASGGVAGEPNLYVWRQGAGVSFVTTLSEADESVWAVESDRRRQAKMTPDGSFLAFASTAPLDPGFDNVDPVSSIPHREVYLYSPGGTMKCVSCVGQGPATADASLTPMNVGFYGYGGRFPAFVRQNLTTDGGQLYFDSREALVGRDVNGTIDVYRYDRGTEGLALISSGSGREPSSFAGASPTGADVFFITRQSLVSRDVDTLSDLYDARVDGGFAEAAGQAPGCGADSCQGQGAVAPPATSPGTASLFGPPNQPARKMARKHCLAKPHKKGARKKACGKKQKQKNKRHKRRRHTKQQRSLRSNRHGA